MQSKMDHAILDQIVSNSFVIIYIHTNIVIMNGFIQNANDRAIVAEQKLPRVEQQLPEAKQ